MSSPGKNLGSQLKKVNSSIQELMGEGSEDIRLKTEDLQQVLQKGVFTKEFTNKEGEKQQLILRTKENEIIGKIEGGKVNISKVPNSEIWVKTEQLKEFKSQKNSKMDCEVINKQSGQSIKGEIVKVENKISIKPKGKIGVFKTEAKTKELSKGKNKSKAQEKNLKAAKPKVQKMKMKL